MVFFFVSRLKNNAKYEVVETLFETELSDKQAGVIKSQHIHLQYNKDKNPKNPDFDTFFLYVFIFLIIRIL